VEATQVSQGRILEAVETKQFATGKSSGRDRRVKKNFQNQYARQENLEVLAGQTSG
jgi:hypothetical protein